MVLLTGADFWSLHPEPAIGLRRLVVSDGPAGVRGERWDERDPSANVPSPSALAAPWDEARVERLGRLLAAEARRKVVQVYASRPDSTLAGFALADAAPGETTTVDVVVRARSLAHWDVESEAWRIEHGSFTLTAGPLDTALPSGEAAS